MKKLLTYIFISIFLMSFNSCGSDDDGNSSNDPSTPKHYRRTIMAYVMADNNLNKYLNTDINDMVTGSKGLASDCQVLAFVDMKNSKPCIVRIADGKKEIVRSWTENVYSTSAETMLDAFQWIVSNYPADEYATIFEGHGTGSLITSHTSDNHDSIPSDVVRLNAYGYDDRGTTNSDIKTWINIPSIAAVMSHLPKMQFVFFDCCCLANIETVYELRKYTDYIVALVSETPGDGAPYREIIPCMELDKSVACDSIASKYAKAYNSDTYGICVSYFSTDEAALTELLNATKALTKKLPTDGKGMTKPNISNVVYYYNLYGSTLNVKPALFDMKSLFAQNGISNSEIEEWEKAVKKVVIKTYPEKPTDFKWFSTIGVNDYRYSFKCNAANYSGMNMFVPLPMYDDFAIVKSTVSLNKSMYNLEWTRKVFF